jgi:hypothetical protein
VTTIFRIRRKVTIGAWTFAGYVEVPVGTTFMNGAASGPISIGDTTLESLAAYAIDDRWAVGVEARLIARTGSATLSSDSWQVQPGAGIRYSVPEWGQGSYIVPTVRYASSFDESLGSQRTSVLQFAPTVNIALTEKTFVTLFPSNDLRVNLGPSAFRQTGPLFLPFDASIGTSLTDKVQLSVEVAVPLIKDYPVYDLKAEGRIRVSY